MTDKELIHKLQRIVGEALYLLNDNPYTRTDRDRQFDECRRQDWVRLLEELYGQSSITRG